MTKYDLPINDQNSYIVSSFICHSVKCIKLTGTLSLDFFCQTEGISILGNELIHKEMVECSQTSKSKEQKHKNKDYLKHSILDEIWDLIESVSEGFLTYSFIFFAIMADD